MVRSPARLVTEVRCCASRLAPGVLYDKEQAKQSTVEIFLYDSRTQEECLGRKLFRSPRCDWGRVSQVKKGDKLFLLNYETSQLHGIFEAISDG
jgi:hypothetical protein